MTPRPLTLDELERQTRVAETEQVVLVGDGMGPPAVGPVGTAGVDAAEGDGD